MPFIVARGLASRTVSLMAHSNDATTLYFGANDAGVRWSVNPSTGQTFAGRFSLTDRQKLPVLTVSAAAPSGSQTNREKAAAARQDGREIGDGATSRTIVRLHTTCTTGNHGACGRWTVLPKGAPQHLFI